MAGPLNWNERATPHGSGHEVTAREHPRDNRRSIRRASPEGGDSGTWKMWRCVEVSFEERKVSDRGLKGGDEEGRGTSRRYARGRGRPRGKGKTRGLGREKEPRDS